MKKRAEITELSEMSEPVEVTKRDYVLGLIGSGLGFIGAVLVSSVLYNGLHWYQAVGLALIGISWLALRNNPWNKTPTIPGAAVVPVLGRPFKRLRVRRKATAWFVGIATVVLAYFVTMAVVSRVWDGLAASVAVYVIVVGLVLILTRKTKTRTPSNVS